MALSGTDDNPAPCGPCCECSADTHTCEDCPVFMDEEPDEQQEWMEGNAYDAGREDDYGKNGGPLEPRD